MKVPNIVFCAYRKWALDVVFKVSENFGERISSTICIDRRSLKNIASGEKGSAS